MNRSTLYYLILIALIAIIVFIVVYKLVQKPTQPSATPTPTPSATPTPTPTPSPLNLKQITVSGDYYMTITSTPNNEITDAVVPTPITIYAPVGYYVNLFNKSNMSYVQSFQIS